MFSCPAYDVAVGPVGSEAARVCDTQHGWVYDYVEQLQPDMVLMSTLAGSVVKLASGTNDASALTEYGDAAAATLTRLAPSVGELVVISPPPANEKPVTECKTPTNAPAACVYEASSLYRSVLDAERTAVAAVPDKARYIDVSPWLCNGGLLPAVHRHDAGVVGRHPPHRPGVGEPRPALRRGAVRRGAGGDGRGGGLSGRSAYSDASGFGDDVVDAADELADVIRLDRDERGDTQLVAAELAVRLGVDDAVGAQRLRDRGRVDAVVEVDRRDDGGAVRGIGDERRGERGCLGPVVQGPG